MLPVRDPYGMKKSAQEYQKSMANVIKDDETTSETYISKVILAKNKPTQESFVWKMV